ncbi:hypothetical protein ILUMI_16198, partial [Ignelater luminosus]
SVSPGYVSTELVDAANKRSGATSSSEQQEFAKTIPSLQPSDIADGVLYALATPPHVQV